MPDLRNLKFAVLAAEHRSFSRAAKQLGVKQATLSRHILDLEGRLGLRLFERSTRGATPTAEGHRIVALGRKILDDVQLIKSSAEALRKGVAGRLVVGFHISLSAGNLRSILLHYGQNHPEVSFEAVERDRVQLTEGLTLGMVDACILAGDTPIDGASMMPAWSERMMVLVPTEHYLANRSRIYWSDLRDEAFLVPQRDPGPELVDMIVSHLAEPGFRPKIFVRDVSPENILHFTGVANAVTIAGQSASGTHYPGAEFHELFEANGPTQIGFSVYWRDDNRNPALGAFIRHLRDRFA